MTADQGDPIPLGLPGQQNYSSLILGRAVIEGGARFVQQEHTGVELQGAKQPEKLALTTCEMTGVLAGCGPAATNPEVCMEAKRELVEVLAND